MGIDAGGYFAKAFPERRKVTQSGVMRDIDLATWGSNAGSFSASMYRSISIPSQTTRTMRELIHGYDKGRDPGSLHYLSKSTHQFIRTKALQAHSWLLYPKGVAITP